MTIAQRLWLSATLTLAALLAMTLLVLWAANTTDEGATARRNALTRVIASERVLAALRDAEAGERGFLLTGDELYLIPYEAAKMALPERLAQLDTDLTGQIHLGGRVAELRRTADAKFAEMAETIALRRAGQVQAALDIVRADTGRAHMAQARAVIAEIQSIQNHVVERHDIEHLAIQRRLVIGLVAGSLIVAACVLATKGLIVLGLRRSFRSFQAGIGRVAAGDLTNDIAIRGRDEISRLARAFNRMMADLREERAGRERAEASLLASETALRGRTAELEHHSRTIDLLGRFANRLHGCTDETEFDHAIETYVPQILCGIPSALYVLNNSQNMLRRTMVWSQPRNAITDFHPSDCWGLRRGQPHLIAADGQDIVCDHVHRDAVSCYGCYPLVAQGETVGLLYIESAESELQLDMRDLQMMTETIAFALVNLRLRDRLHNQSIRDPLTGLFNRRHLEETLELECSREQRVPRGLSALMLDIDHFKRFNDAFGHDAGDLVLRHIADLLKRMARKGDVVCRMGGEEFVILLPRTASDQAAELAEQLRKGVEELEIVYRGQSLGRITVSIGVSSVRAQGADPEELFDTADRALYAAKREGRNRVKS